MHRASQSVIEALVRADGAGVRASQTLSEALIRADGVSSRASQVLIEALASILGVPKPVHAGQIILELLILAPLLRVLMSQFELEILVLNHEVTMPSIYPTLPGITYSVIKRPKFYNAVGSSISGREVRIGYAQNALWEWDLTYNYLPDQPSLSAATASDLKQLMGFYLAMNGAFQGFLFLDPDDNAVIRQPLGTTDGTTTNWTLVRTYGGTDGTGTEPIGYVNTAQPFHLYLAGVLVDPTTYSVLTTTPVFQQIKFNTAPATGLALSVTMSYYYYARFKDDHIDFEKFMDRLWSTGTITLMSLRN